MSRLTDTPTTSFIACLHTANRSASPGPISSRLSPRTPRLSANAAESGPCRTPTDPRAREHTRRERCGARRPTGEPVTGPGQRICTGNMEQCQPRLPCGGICSRRQIHTFCTVYRAGYLENLLLASLGDGDTGRHGRRHRQRQPRGGDPPPCHLLDSAAGRQVWCILSYAWGATVNEVWLNMLASSSSMIQAVDLLQAFRLSTYLRRCL